MLQKLQEMLGKKNGFVITPEFQQVIDAVELTDQHLFVTGKAGTGKSTLIEYIRYNTKKKIVVLAPTGISAINVRGQTIHSFFHLPPRMISRHSIKRAYDDRIYKEIDAIIIDEISMVRADVIDGIDQFLRMNGRDSNLPFGGTQMIFVGDLYQLPPVLRREEAEVFYEMYETPYFFSAGAFNIRDFTNIELSEIFRQKDSTFINVLNDIRIGNASASTLDPINSRQTKKTISRDKHITLTTTNAVAASINSSELNKIDSPEFTYQAAIEGLFPTEDSSLPVELDLVLKKGARVMFTKNEKGRMWVNGTIGVVEELGKELIKVKIEEAGKNEIVEVVREEWENVKYELDRERGELKEKVVGKLKQYPLRLAWAITIHKSQGMTFDNVNIDFSRSPFAHGQTYVALSRCRTIHGILLSKKIYPNDVIVDSRIVEFSKRI